MKSCGPSSRVRNSPIKFWQALLAPFAILYTISLFNQNAFGQNTEISVADRTKRSVFVSIVRITKTESFWAQGDLPGDQIIKTRYFFTPTETPLVGKENSYNDNTFECVGGTINPGTPQELTLYTTFLDHRPEELLGKEVAIFLRNRRSQSSCDTVYKGVEPVENGLIGNRSRAQFRQEVLDADN